MIKMRANEVSRRLIKTGVVALFIPALLACGILSDGPAPTPTAPAGMFSTLPTAEPPIVGDEPGMVLKLASTARAYAYTHANPYA